MISILIPIYNVDVRSLVAGLLAQLVEIGGEIICMDDGSKPAVLRLNAALAEWEGVRYSCLAANIGRSAIRNRLAEQARFDWFLFLDCDGSVAANPGLLASYHRYMREGPVICGGRSYAMRPPAARRYLLHWHYGRRREQLPAQVRMSDPWQGFQSNNFMIARSCMERGGFDESIRGYGHEDTLFGFALARRGDRVVHIDNPVEHIGLEDNETFLRKTRQGIRNLWRLHEMGKQVPTRLWEAWSATRRWKLDRLLALAHPGLAPLLERQLSGRHPRLRLLDLYKLTYLAYWHHQGPAGHRKKAQTGTSFKHIQDENDSI
ncbi:MAG: hypothetical protein RLY31_69 [Bacteroidota bacterium]